MMKEVNKIWLEEMKKHPKGSVLLGRFRFKKPIPNYARCDP